MNVTNNNKNYNDIKETYIPRLLKESDYSKGYMALLSQLTVTGNVTKEEFEKTFNIIKNMKNQFIYVIEDPNTNKVIATSTILIEKKFTHNCGSVGHIEDVVVSKEYRGKGIGKLMINKMIEIGKENKV